jgi:protein phosphatase
MRPELGLWGVADGMGGEEKGEVASRIFVETAIELFVESAASSEEEAKDRVRRTFALANERIFLWAKNNQVAKMGCTAELMVISASDYVLGHVGDSRTYRFRGGQLKQLTRDHSFVQEQLDLGILQPAEAQKSPFRNVLTRAVGAEETLAVDILRGKSAAGDQYLLCSDGLTTMLDDRCIGEELSRPLEPSQKVSHLIEKASLAGGMDNVTVVLCEIVE